jgi:hypothetical protein
MHQPYYTDPLAGSASMPWVRLHATKAYYDMAYLLDQFPEVHATFNFTPSLLLQLEEIATGKIRDLFLEHAYERSQVSKMNPALRFLIWVDSARRPYHFRLQNPARFEVVQPVADIDQAIDDDLCVSAAIGGVDAVAGF